MANIEIYRKPELLHPRAKAQFVDLGGYLADSFKTGKTKTCFGMFETYRSPARQAFCRRMGTSKADPFESPHQYGLAVDFVPYWLAEGTQKHWNWDEDNDFEFLRDAAKKFGMDVPISWDRCHVEHPLWWHIKDELL